MKKCLLVGALSVLLLLSGCGQQNAQTPAEPNTKIEYSNLAEPETQQELTAIMDSAGISKERQATFFEHVNQFNAILSPDELTKGYETGDLSQPKYDPYAVQERWMEAYPEFLGYNCRITAYSLFGDFVTVPEDAEVRNEMLAFDQDALLSDPSAFPEQQQQFVALYSSVPTSNSKNTEEHVKNLKEDWKKRGITFRDQEKVRLISVVFHDMLDENASLFIGHTGLLFPVADDELYFVEKLSFQEPYQCIKFRNRTDLNDYLMSKYDTDYDQPMAAPFIMENDELMEGYHVLEKSADKNSQ